MDNRVNVQKALDPSKAFKRKSNKWCILCSLFSTVPYKERCRIRHRSHDMLNYTLNTYLELVHTPRKLTWNKFVLLTIYRSGAQDLYCIISSFLYFLLLGLSGRSMNMLHCLFSNFYFYLSL